jgi:hypothetical protein
VSHDADFHQFMLYTPVPGTPLHEDMTAAGKMLEGVDLADIHGQYRFNFRHDAISRDDSQSLLDWAFRLDYERNGPSLYRLMRTSFNGWRRYHDHPDARVRQRVAQEASEFRTGYGAALWAMERFFQDGNREVSGRIRALRKEVEREFGLACRALDAALGPLLLWTTRREARRFPRGRRLEPRTFVERRNWLGGQAAEA